MKIVEYWHYYEKQWPTKWTLQSIEVFNKLKENWYFWDQIFKVLFIDDVHDQNPFESETISQCIDFASLWFDKHIFESRTKITALQLIQAMEANNDITVVKDGYKKFLKKGSKTKIELVDGKNPSCVMMDASLTLMKSKYGEHIINILPLSYKKQQENLHKIIYELFSINVLKTPIHLESVLFDSKLTQYDILQTILQPMKAQTLSF